MIPVSSSNISHMGFDPKTSSLRVRFHNGTVGEYQNVDSEKWMALQAIHLEQGSLGSYINQHIKNQHDWVKLDSEESDVDESL